MEIGKEILKLRKKNNLSQEQLAEKMNVSRQTISKWELGETSPDIKQAKKLSKLFNVSLDELVQNDINNILIHKSRDIEESINKTARNIKIIIITIYVIILMSLIFIMVHFLTKRDFTTEYQTEFRCTLGEEDYNLSLGLTYDSVIEPIEAVDDVIIETDFPKIYHYYIDVYDYKNQYTDKILAGFSLNDAVESIMELKKYYIENGYTCR